MTFLWYYHEHNFMLTFCDTLPIYFDIMSTSVFLLSHYTFIKVYAQRFFTSCFFITKWRQGPNKYISVNFNALATQFHI